jgi:hypothetical protein
LARGLETAPKKRKVQIPISQRIKKAWKPTAERAQVGIFRNKLVGHTLPELSTIKQKRGVFLSHDGRDTDSGTGSIPKRRSTGRVALLCAAPLGKERWSERRAREQPPSSVERLHSLRRTMGKQKPRKISPTYFDWSQSGLAAWRFCLES